MTTFAPVDPGGRATPMPPDPVPVSAWHDGRLLPSSPVVDYLGHRRRYGTLPILRLDQLVAATTVVASTGRGGAGFPLSRKLSAAGGRFERPVLMLNWCEGDPTAAKDAALARRSPQLVLDGLVVAAAALKAARVIVAVRAGSSTATRVAAAIDQRPEASRLTMLTAPPRFVASEASALVSLASGRGARPLGRLTPIWDSGVDGKPTLVLNAETAAQLAVLAYLGPDGFAAVGDRREPGTALLTIGGSVPRPGVYEIPTGTAIGVPLLAAGAPAQGWALTGGVTGTWTALETLGRTGFSTPELRDAGITRGVGSVVVLGDGCLLAETAGLLAYLADESAGQCGPCMFGLPSIAADFAALTAGDRRALHRLHRRLPVIDGRGGCAHPDGAVAVAAGAISVLTGPLRGHLDQHLTSGPCGAPAVLRWSER